MFAEVEKISVSAAEQVAAAPEKDQCAAVASMSDASMERLARSAQTSYSVLATARIVEQAQVGGARAFLRGIQDMSKVQKADKAKLADLPWYRPFAKAALAEQIEQREKKLEQSKRDFVANGYQAALNRANSPEGRAQAEYLSQKIEKAGGLIKTIDMDRERRRVEYAERARKTAQELRQHAKESEEIYQFQAERAREEARRQHQQELAESRDGARQIGAEKAAEHQVHQRTLALLERIRQSAADRPYERPRGG